MGEALDKSIRKKSLEHKVEDTLCSTSFLTIECGSHQDVSLREKSPKEYVF